MHANGWAIYFGSKKVATINQHDEMIMGAAGKKLSIRHIEWPLGVRGRNSDSWLFREKLGWAPEQLLRDGIVKTYEWIVQQVSQAG